MAENKDFDMDEILDELSSQIEDMVEDAVEERVEELVEDALDDMLADMVKDALDELIRDGFEFVLKDGTVVTPKERMMVVSPGKSRMLLCYGGLRVDGTSLMIQTAPYRYENIAHYKTREEAIAALVRVSEAMDAGLTRFEL